MCYGDPSATEVPPCCETATKKLTFSTTSVLLLLNMPLSLSRATIFRRQKNPRRVYRPQIAGILFVCNEPEGKYYTVPWSLPCRASGDGCFCYYCHLVDNVYGKWCGFCLPFLSVAGPFPPRPPLFFYRRCGPLHFLPPTQRCSIKRCPAQNNQNQNNNSCFKLILGEDPTWARLTKPV